MATSSRIYCFESEWALKYIGQVRPEWVPYLISFPKLIELVSGGLPGTTEDRFAAFCELLPEASEARRASFFYTIERLREALVLTPEDVDFCFAALPETPKNAELKSTFLAYLDSERSSNDWAGRVWTTIERLKNSPHRPPLAEALYFIPGEASSPLFHEVAAAFRNSGDNVTVSELWELAFDEKSPKAPPCRGYALVGESASLLSRMASRAARLAKTRHGAPIWIPFCGTPHDREYLKYELSRLRLKVADWMPEISPPYPSTSDFSRRVAALRQDHRLPLKDRLALGALLAEHKISQRRRTSWSDLVERLVSLKKVSSSQREYLLSLSTTSKPSPFEVSSNDSAVLVPFTALPVGTALAYAGSNFFTPPKTLWALREEELFLLKQQGISISQTSDYAKRQRTLLHSLGTGKIRTGLYASLPLRDLEFPGKAFAFRLAPPWGASAEQSYTAAVGPKSLSATQLESYARCPTQYFFSNRLRLRAFGPLSEESFALLYGQIVHLALEDFFREKAPEESVSASGLAQAFEKAAGKLAPTLSTEHPLMVTMRSDFVRMAALVPRLESDLRSFGVPIKPWSFELPFRIDLGDISVTGKIDRIDRSDSGQVLVLDYKTGNVDFCPDHINQGVHFQALLYLLALESQGAPNPIGILFYDLKKGEVRRGIVIEERVPPEVKKKITRGHLLPQAEWEALRSRGKAHLNDIAGKIARGDFTPTPDNSTCSYCDFTAFCRKAPGFS